MARDISLGHVLVTERTFKSMKRPEIDKLQFEMNRLLTSIRGNQPPLDEIDALRDRNRKIGRITGAQRVLTYYLQQLKTG